MLWKHKSASEEEEIIVFFMWLRATSKTFFPNPILTLLWTKLTQEPVVRNVCT